MATQPSLRIGDRERDAVAAELQEHYAHGRLTLEEFNQRLDAVFAAKTQADLSRLTADLPHIRSGGGPLPSSRTSRSPSLASGPPASGWAAGRVSAGAVSAGGDWPVSWSSGNWHGGNWSGHSRHRGGFAGLSTLLAAVASWLLVYQVLLVGMHFAWPGRVGLLVAIFTVIRGLLRRIFRGARRR
ncbi:MAG TPA: DUF1707 domain-containing protein [Streptosporangiaceae bacterium]|jgi:hypothetical protein|nr:DUF1707 domain-containing protein [Streptosporangiaceae bacterium]